MARTFTTSPSLARHRRELLDDPVWRTPSCSEHHDRGEQGILTPPSLIGAQPGTFTQDGKTIRPMGQESDKGLALLNALDENQKKQAILAFRVADLVLGPGEDGKTIQPEGLKASSLNDKQKDMLLDVISEWAGIVHEAAAAARLAELKADLNSTWFAWSGPVTGTIGTNITAYYRIQGPHVVIEYAPKAWAATRRIISTRCTAIRPTTTAANETAASHRDPRLACIRASARRVSAGNAHLGQQDRIAS